MICPNCGAFLTKKQFYLSNLLDESHQKAKSETIYICRSCIKTYFEEELD